MNILNLREQVRVNEVPTRLPSLWDTKWWQITREVQLPVLGWWTCSTETHAFAKTGQKSQDTDAMCLQEACNRTSNCGTGFKDFKTKEGERTKAHGTDRKATEEVATGCAAENPARRFYATTEGFIGGMDDTLCVLSCNRRVSTFSSWRSERSSDTRPRFVACSSMCTWNTASRRQWWEQFRKESWRWDLKLAAFGKFQMFIFIFNLHWFNVLYIANDSQFGLQKPTPEVLLPSRTAAVALADAPGKMRSSVSNSHVRGLLAHHSRGVLASWHLSYPQI